MKSLTSLRVERVIVEKLNEILVKFTRISTKIKSHTIADASSSPPARSRRLLSQCGRRGPKTIMINK